MNHRMSADIELLEKVKTDVKIDAEEAGIVVVHCVFPGDGRIRIWPSTYLFDRSSSHYSKLLHVENICLAPQWMDVVDKQYVFTLYFEALPKSCKVFDLREVIDEWGAFEAFGIIRNATDVYRVEI
jgi:hypothetical protein